MARLLARLGLACARRAGLVVTAWVLLLALAGGAFAVWGGTLASALSLPGTPTARTTDLLRTALPQASGGSGSAVWATRDGSALTAEQRAAISAGLARVAAVEGVEGVVDPFATEQQRADGAVQLEQGAAQLDAGLAQLESARAQLQGAAELGRGDPAALAEVEGQLARARAEQVQLEQGATLLELAEGYRTVSEDGSAALGTVTFPQAVQEVPQETRDAVLEAVRGVPVAGVDVDVTSDLAGTEVAVGAGELVGLAIAAVVLVAVLGTVVGAALPLVGAVVGVGVAVCAALALSGTVEMAAATPLLGVMLGLAVGIDYSLFILNRHRRQLLDGADLLASIALATGTSGTAVLFAGSTVVIALVALATSGIGFLALMGAVAAVCVTVAVAVAVTLLPALMRLLGRRVLRRSERARLSGHRRPVHRAPSSGPGATARAMSTPRAVATVVLASLALAVVAVPALSMRLGLPDGSSEAEDSTQYRAYATTASAFGAGRNGPLVVVAELPGGADAASASAFSVDAALAVAEVPDVAAVVPIGTADDLSVTAFQVVPTTGPTTAATTDLVERLRATTVAGAPSPLLVAGAASGNIDISDQLARALPVYLAVVIGLSMVLLVLVFRSLVVPVVATGGFVLSLLAAFGGVTAIFQWGWLGPLFGVHDPGPVLNFLPTVAVGILFGLAMDYQLFIGSGIREAHVHGLPARQAVTAGLRAGRTVVIAAAVIMVAVFGGFVFSPTTLIRQVGFALAFGVLVDAFVVRMLLVPAVLHLLGERAWWLPRWLDRLLPDVDVEGASLERHPAGRAPGALEPVTAGTGGVPAR